MENSRQVHQSHDAKPDQTSTQKQVKIFINKSSYRLYDAGILGKAHTKTFLSSLVIVSDIMKHPQSGNVKLGQKQSSLRIKVPKRCYPQKVDPYSLANISDVCLKIKFN